MICCAENHDTPFCPSCGKALRAQNPLEELLLHCRARLRIQQRDLKHDQQGDGDIQERIAANIAKWERWCEALAKALAAPATSMETD